jgi:hypothetical protein
MTTWTPKIKQIETWTAETDQMRVFDPAVFDPSPIFDTGQAGGKWTPSAIQAEAWTAKDAP